MTQSFILFVRFGNDIAVFTTSETQKGEHEITPLIPIEPPRLKVGQQRSLFSRIMKRYYFKSKLCVLLINDKRLNHIYSYRHGW